MHTSPEIQESSPFSIPETLPGLLARNRQRYGDATALREKDLGVWKEVSWNHYYDHVKHVCLGLIKLGLQKGDKLAILGDNCREWLYADLAAQTLGAVSVGIYATNPAKQVKYVLGHSDSVMVVVKDQEQTDKVLEVKEQLPKLKKIIVIDMKGLRHYREPEIVSFNRAEELGQEKFKESPGLFETLISQTEPADVALMVYTSGTTGPPKGAMLTHHNLISLAGSFSSVLYLSSEDQVVSYLPLCHIAERLMSVILALSAGYVVNFAESIDTVQESICEIAPTLFVGVPRIWEKMHASINIRMKSATPFKRLAYRFWIPVGRRIVERELQGERIHIGWKLLYWSGYICLYRYLLDKLGLVKVRNAISGAAPIAPEILKFFRLLGLKISEVYGQTEVSGVSHIHHGYERKVGSVGKPLPGVECRLGEDGEIMSRSEMLFAGYYKDPEATEKARGDGWMHSGDMGVLDDEGYLYITDRKKDIIITAGGKNIAPSEMENRLKCSPYINEAIVMGDRKPYLTALIQIELDTVSNWAQDNKIAYTTFKSLAQNPDVYELIKKEVDEANKEFARVEAIKKFTLLDKELDHDDDELTATMKVRRKTVEDKFNDIIHSMYGRR
ncbi:MAG: AMP-binding protein [Desulfobacteraceae bacterium]|nr:MAG: AMP-binding protein [Desulfobacteraceae bacterium]